MPSPGLQEGTGGGGTAPAAAGGAAAARGPLLGGVCPRQAPSPGWGKASCHPRPTHGGARGAVDTGSPGEKPRMWRRSRGPLSLCGRPPFFPPQTKQHAEPQDRLMGKSHLPLQHDAWAGGSPPTPGPRQAPRCACSMQCGPHSMCSHVHSRGDRRSVCPIGPRARRWRVGPGASCCTPHVVGAGHRAQQRARLPACWPLMACWPFH